MKYQIIGGLTASLLLTGAALGAPKAAQKAQAVGDRQITIHIHNYARANTSVVLHAERAAGNMLRNAGVNAVWVACPIEPDDSRDGQCAKSFSSLDLVLNLLPRSMSDRLRQPDGVLGLALEPSGNGFGSIAFIFYDVAKDYAGQQRQDVDQLLGDAIAHELGHLLLGTNSHSRSGLMSAFWSRKQLIVVQQGGLAFSAAEAKRIQAAMTARVLAATEFPQEGQSLVTDSSSE